MLLHIVDYLTGNFKGCRYVEGFYEHMQEYEGEIPHRVTTVEPVEPGDTEDKAGMAFGFDEDAPDGIM